MGVKLAIVSGIEFQREPPSSDRILRQRDEREADKTDGSDAVAAQDDVPPAIRLQRRLGEWTFEQGLSINVHMDATVKQGAHDVRNPDIDIGFLL